MFPRPGRLWPQGRVHATFTPDIMGKTLLVNKKSEIALAGISCALYCTIFVVPGGLGLVKKLKCWLYDQSQLLQRRLKAVAVRFLSLFAVEDFSHYSGKAGK